MHFLSRFGWLAIHLNAVVVADSFRYGSSFDYSAYLQKLI
jgi:hypothetical protein